MDQSEKEPPLVKEIGIEDIGDAIDVKKLIRGMFRHVLVIGIFLSAFTYGGWKLAEMIKSQYKAQAVMIFNQVDSDFLEADYDLIRFSLPSAVEMITLPSNIKAVKSILGLDMKIQDLKEIITVDLPILDSNLVNVVVEDENPTLAIDIANTLAHVAVKNSQNLARKQWHAAYLYFKEKGIELTQKLDQQMEGINTFRRENKLLGTDLSGLMTSQVLNAAEHQQQQSNLAYMRLLVEYENLKREFSKIPELIERPMLRESTLQNRITQIDTILLEARTRYAPKNPKIQALEAQLEELKKKAYEVDPEEDKIVLTQQNPLRKKLDLDLVGMQAKLRATLKIKEEMGLIVKNLEKETEDYNEKNIVLIDLLQERKLTEAKIARNEESVRETEVKLHLGKGDIELYQEAEKAFPYEGSFVVDLLPFFGAIVGAIVGLFVSFLIEVADRRIRTERQIELLYNVPCLSVFPEMSFLTRWNSDRKTKFHIRSLAERLELSTKEHKTLGLVSSTCKEGKSFIAYHLGVFYAEQGKKCCVVELDPRKSSSFPSKMSPKKSGEQFLTGKAAWDEIVAKGSPDHIKMQDLELFDSMLGSEEMASFWCQLTDHYDKVILDIPGIIDQESSLSLAKVADEVLFVIGSKRVNKSYIDSSLKILDIYQIRPCGIALNRVLSSYIDNVRIKMLGREKRGLAILRSKKRKKTGGSRIALS